MDYKLIAMDLDGTLTQHRSKLNPSNREVLDALGKNYSLVIVAAGSCKRVFEQMDRYQVDIIGNYGIQETSIINDELVYQKAERYEVDRQYFIERTEDIRSKYGYEEYTGESVEFHDSGVVTLPLLGTEANIQDKLKFDPDGKKRSFMYDYVSSQFSDYNCFIGGSSSFDIVSRRYDKAKALEDYCTRKGIDFDRVLYVGDDFKKGGNDEPIVHSPFDYLVIKDYSCVGTDLKNAGVLR